MLWVTNNIIYRWIKLAKARFPCTIQNIYLSNGCDGDIKMNMNARMKAVFLAALSASLLIAPLQAYAVSSKKALYDGTVTQIPKSQSGKLVTGNANLRFLWKDASYAIPYDSITDMEYGDKPSTESELR